MAHAHARRRGNSQVLIKAALSLASPGGSRGRLSVLIFHRVLAARDPLFPDEPDIARFDELMRWVREWFNVLPLDEAVSRLKNGKLPARAAALSFDDGYADNFLHALPVLQQHGLTATFFIATGFVDGGRMWNDTIITSVRGTSMVTIDCAFLGLGQLVVGSDEEKRSAIDRLIGGIKHLPGERRIEAVARVADSCKAALPDDLMLTRPQIRELRRTGMGIGAHTVTHPILAKSSDAVARREIADSRDFLAEVIGERIGLFAYPNGRIGSDYTASHVAMAETLGFDAAFATNWGVCTGASDIYQLPRFTPWDVDRRRFGLRLLMNTGRRDAALTAGAG
jgi:peptidoglycan/xylan/chitin deacetylase (PgdA/CDA1 family)